MKVCARKSLGITGVDGIIGLRGENASNSIAWLRALQRFQPERSVGQAMFRFAVFWRGLRAEYLVSAGIRLLPSSGNVMPWSRGCLPILCRGSYGTSPTVETRGSRGWRPWLIRLRLRMHERQE